MQFANNCNLRGYMVAVNLSSEAVYRQGPCQGLLCGGRGVVQCV